MTDPMPEPMTAAVRASCGQHDGCIYPACDCELRPMTARNAVLAYLRTARERLAGISPRSVTLAKQNFHLLGGIDALLAEIEGDPHAR